MTDEVKSFTVVRADASARASRVAATERAGLRRARRNTPRTSWLVPTLYIIFLMLPIYWLINMSLKTNTEITSTFTLWPREFTLRNYAVIFTDPSWYSGYINSIAYVALNTAISIAVALPAAYAFSRWRFLGDNHLFFWLLTNRMAPPAVFALPFFQLRNRPETDPYRYLTPDGSIEGTPPRIDPRAYQAATPGRVDYLIVAGRPVAEQQVLSAPSWLALDRQIEADFALVATSSDGYFELYGQRGPDGVAPVAGSACPT